MKKEVKFICSNCAEVNFKSRKDLFFDVVSSCFIFLGILLLLFLLVFGSVVWPFFSSVIFTKFANNADPFFDARSYVLDNTDYDGRDSVEMIYLLMVNMPHIRYVPSSFFSPIQGYSETLSDGGDCKNVAVLFTKLMLDTGYVSFVDCNFHEAHCVSVIPYDGYNSDYFGTYAVVDLTNDCVAIYDSDNNHWVAAPIDVECFYK